MKRDEMIQRIDVELDHIPRGDKGSTQNAFRMHYNIHRRKDLAQRRDSPASQTLIKAITSVTQEYPYFSPSFNDDFFQKRGEC